jgi:hypothetical protein
MDHFLAISIICALISIIFEWGKKKWGVESHESKMLMISISMLVGAVYYFASSLAIWQSVLGILAASSTMYAMFYSNK